MILLVTITMMEQFPDQAESDQDIRHRWSRELKELGFKWFGIGVLISCVSTAIASLGVEEAYAVGFAAAPIYILGSLAVGVSRVADILSRAGHDNGPLE